MRDASGVRVTEGLLDALYLVHPDLICLGCTWTDKHNIAYCSASELDVWDYQSCRLYDREIMKMVLCVGYKYLRGLSNLLTLQPDESCVRDQIAALLRENMLLREIYIVMPYKVMIVTDYRI